MYTVCHPFEKPSSRTFIALMYAGPHPSCLRALYSLCRNDGRVAQSDVCLCEEVLSRFSQCCFKNNKKCHSTQTHARECWLHSGARCEEKKRFS